MSAAAGVPAWARPVLEALRMTAADVALGHDGILSVHARRLADACAAALASDAGTPVEEDELEAVIGDLERLAGPGKTLQWCDGTGAMTIGEKLRSLVARRAQAAHDIGFRRGLRELPPDLRRPPEDDELPRAVDMMAAMEAPAPAPGDASGETADNFEAALSEYVEAALDCAADDSNQPYERLRGRRELARQQVMRLYRAATGEVVLADDEMVERVATAMHNRVEAPHSIFWQSWETQTEFNRQCARRWVKDVLTVTQSVLGEDLVRRRDKEGV